MRISAFLEQILWKIQILMEIEVIFIFIKTGKSRM